jgi:hypothetical protein
MDATRRISVARLLAHARGPAAIVPERRAIGYVCGDPRAHTEAIRSCCEERGLALVTIVHDVDPGGDDHRPSLAWALKQLAERRADVLVLARLHDLSANPANIRPLLTWFDQEQRTLIALDTPAAGWAVSDVPELQRRIAAMREQGMTLQAIADTLNDEGVPTVRGGAQWRPSSVQRATGYRRPSSGGRGIAPR